MIPVPVTARLIPKRRCDLIKLTPDLGSRNEYFTHEPHILCLTPHRPLGVAFLLSCTALWTAMWMNLVRLGTLGRIANPHAPLAAEDKVES